MQTILVTLLLFLCVGLFTRKYTAWTRLLLSVIIAGMLFFLYFR